MRTHPLPLLFAVLANLACANPPAVAQNTISRRVADAPDGTVGFSFPARPEVCGDGRTFIGERSADDRQFNIYTAQGLSIGEWGDSDVRGRCVHGPVRVILEVQRDRVLDVRPYVGASRLIPARTDLGEVSGAEAAQYLLQIAREQRDIASDAMLSAAMAAGASITPTLIDYARDNALDSETRQSALKWVGRAAAREGTIDRGIAAAQEITISRAAPIDLRERAVRVLGELPGGDRIVREIFDRLDHSVLKERAVRVVAESGGRENAEWVQRIAFDRAEPLEIRERALRVLGEELGDTRSLRALYDRLDQEVLRERVVRTVGESGTADDIAWLRAVVLNASESESVRERALRLIGENGSSGALRELFTRLDSYSLRERAVRLVAEHGTREDMTWIEQLVTSANAESELRERAVRSLAEAGIATTRLSTIFDRSNDPVVRERIVRLLGERADDDAVDKLRAILRSERDTDVRERAARILAEIRR